MKFVMVSQFSLGRSTRWGSKQNKFTRTQVWTSAFMGLAFGTLAMGQPAHSAEQVENACKLMQQKPGWYSSAVATAEKWQVPLPSILAIIRQESRFVATASARQSSAFGFAQALDGTWNAYRRATKAYHADRTSFADSVEFIAWYMVETRKRMGLPAEDIARHYLAYHEGHAGFRSTRWEEKPRLIRVAQKVAETAWAYQQQLRNCAISLPVVGAPEAAPLPGRKPFALSHVQARTPEPKPVDRYVAELNPASDSRFVPIRLD